MQVELSKQDILVIEQALSDWEQNPMHEGMMGSMFSALLTPKGEARTAEIHNEIDVAKKKVQDRRLISTLLRAKLIQALNRETEHSL